MKPLLHKEEGNFCIVNLKKKKKQKTERMGEKKICKAGREVFVPLRNKSSGVTVLILEIS